MHIFTRKNQANPAPHTNFSSPPPFSPFPSTSTTCPITRPDKAFFRTLNIGRPSALSPSKNTKGGAHPPPSTRTPVCTVGGEYAKLSPERIQRASARVSRMKAWLRRRQGTKAPLSPPVSIPRSESRAQDQEGGDVKEEQGGRQHRRYDSGTCISPPLPPPSPPVSPRGVESCGTEDFLAWTVFPLALPPHAQQAFQCVVCAGSVAPTWYDASACRLWKVMGCKPGCGIMHEGCLMGGMGASEEEERKGCEKCWAFMRVVRGMDEREFGERVRRLGRARGRN